MAQPHDRNLHRLRTAATLESVGPAYGAGLRGAIAAIVPLALGIFFGVPGGTWVSLGAFNGTLADRGGSYRTRALTLGALTLAAAVAVTLCSIGAGRLVLAVPLTFVVALACGLARVWGAGGATVGNAVLCMFLITLGLPAATGAEIGLRALFTAAGGAWVMLIALVLCRCVLPASARRAPRPRRGSRAGHGAPGLLAHARLERVARQLRSMHEMATRAALASASTARAAAS